MSFQLSLSTDSVSAAYPDQPLFVTPASTVGEVIQLLCAQQTGSVLVCEEDADGGKPLGIFTERDALKCMAAASSGAVLTKERQDGAGQAGSNASVMQQPVSTVMSTDLTTLQADANVGEMVRKMSQGGYRHIPIVDADGKPTGMETVYGLVHFLVDHMPQTIYNLPPDPHSIPSEREGA